MSFSITFIEDNQDNRNKAHVKEMQRGTIVIGEFKETFESPLLFWSVSDYQAHWKQALERIVSGALNSCLITSIYDPGISNFWIWWLLYREGQMVYIQNHLLFLERLKSVLDPLNPYIHIPERRVINEDGQQISEWQTSIKAIEQFLRTLK